MIDSSLLQDFITETTEHLEEMEENLLLLEKNPEDLEMINSIFRSVHTIKGSAEYLGMQKIANLAHDLESLMDKIRNGELGVDQKTIDVIIASGDKINTLVGDLINDGEERTAIDGCLEEIHSLMKNKSVDEKDRNIEEKVGIDRFHENEAYDHELYTIFVQNLREMLTDFNVTLSNVKTCDDPVMGLNDCVFLIGSLESSANYMGYDHLSDILAGITGDVQALIEQSSNFLEPSIFEKAATEVETRIDKICELFEINRSDIGSIRIQMEEKNSSKTSFPNDFPDENALLLQIDSAFMDEPPSGNSAKTVDGNPKAFEGSNVISNEDTPENAYEEEYDSELFDIFFQQLEEDLAWYKEDVEMLAAADDPGETPDETLSRWKTKLGSLKSSANYMGYGKLTGIYGDWENRLNALEKKLCEGMKNDWQKELFASVSDAMEGVGVLFPSLAPSKPIRHETESIIAEIEDAFADIEGLEPLESSSGQSSLLSNALRDKISKLPVHSETPHEVVADFLFTDTNDADHGLSVPEGQNYNKRPQEKESPTIVSDRQGGKPKTGVEKEASNLIHSQDIPEKETAKDLPQNVEKRVADAKLIDEEKLNSVSEKKEATTYAKKIRSQSIRVDANKIDALMNQVGELVVSRAWFSQLHHEMKDLKQKLFQRESIDKRLAKQISQMTFRLHEATSSLGRAANELQEGVMRIRMLPVARLFNRYPRLIHDLLKEGDKQVQLEIKGEDTELDKMVIEKISDPMIHIIRNAIDHGVEKSSERRRIGKTETATLVIEAYHESNHVVIELTDDGRGIDPIKIKKKVLRKKLMASADIERMTDREIISLITKPGFSTADKVTHISGRGVGMDVVKKNIEELNGTVEIDSIPGKETRIRIKIPLTLAIIPALLVRVETELFTIPLSTVEETIKVNVMDIESIEGNEVIYLRNQTIPLIRLNRVFNMSSRISDSESAFIVIVSNGMNKMGLVVDSMLGQEEVVIKPLEDYLQESSGFSGATILGDGRISLILDIYDLLNISVAKMEHRRKTRAASFG